jgi:TH1 protein
MAGHSPPPCLSVYFRGSCCYSTACLPVCLFLSILLLQCCQSCIQPKAVPACPSVCTVHPGGVCLSVRSQLVALLSRSLAAMGNSKPELARGFLEAGMSLLRLGEVERVLRFVEAWARAADPSLVRFFVFRVLDAVQPPYSSYFAAAVLRCGGGAGPRVFRAADAPNLQPAVAPAS